MIFQLSLIVITVDNFSNHHKMVQHIIEQNIS